MRYNSAIIAASLFALSGLIVPSSLNGADAASLIKAKNFGSATTSTCDTTHQEANLDADCKPDSKKTSKIDLDRKGHKVKKSKSRGR